MQSIRQALLAVQVALVGCLMNFSIIQPHHHQGILPRHPQTHDQPQHEPPIINPPSNQYLNLTTRHRMAGLTRTEIWYGFMKRILYDTSANNKIYVEIDINYPIPREQVLPHSCSLDIVKLTHLCIPVTQTLW